MENMRQIGIEKITLNIGAGNSKELLTKGLKLLKNITAHTPVQTISNKRIPTWGVRPGLAIGCKVTIRGKEATELLKRLFTAVNNKLKKSKFDEQGNFAFGIPEYLEIPGVEYDAEVGIIGLEVAVTLMRPGFRIKRKKIKFKKVAKKHRISKQEAMEFIQKEFGVKM